MGKEKINIMLSVMKEDLFKGYANATPEEKMAMEQLFGVNTFEPDIKVSLVSLQQTYKSLPEGSVQKRVLENIYGKFLNVPVEETKTQDEVKQVEKPKLTPVGKPKGGVKKSEKKMDS